MWPQVVSSVEVEEGGIFVEEAGEDGCEGGKVNLLRRSNRDLGVIIRTCKGRLASGMLWR